MWTKVQNKCRQFFFAEEVPYGFALMRICLSLVLLDGVLRRWAHCIDLFSSGGTPYSLFESYGHPMLLVPMPPFWTACAYTMLVLFLITSCLGFCTRISLCGVLVLHTYFAINDLTSSITKFTVISTHAFLLMAVSECGRIWSVDSWLASRRDPSRVWDSDRPTWALAPVWPQKLLMILIGVVYLGAAVTKLHMPVFLTGEAMAYWIMSNPNFRHFIGEWFSQSPSLLIASAHFTVLWEVVFLFTMWRGIPRYIMFGLGLFFHIMSALTLGEIVFMMVMSSTYLGCLTEAEMIFCKKWLTRLTTPMTTRLGLAKLKGIDFGTWLPNRMLTASPQAHLFCFLSLLTASGVVGGWLNERMDYYGTQRTEGLYELTELPDHEAARLLKPFEPVREVDKFLAVDIGTFVVAGRLADRRNEFRYGDVVICETSFNPPHDDMYVECNFVDGKKVINRVGAIVSREQSFAHFQYRLTDALEPGTYQLQIKSRGKEICRRELTIEKGLIGLVANREPESE